MEIQKDAISPRASLVQTANILYSQGQFAEALVLVQAAVEGSRTLQTVPWQLLRLGVKMYNQLAEKEPRVRQSDPLKKAEQLLKVWKQVPASKESKEQETKCQILTLLNQARCFQVAQKYHKALIALMKACKLGGKCGRPRYLAKVLLALSIFYADVRSFFESEMYARQALTVLQEALKTAATEGKVKIQKLSELYVQAFGQIGAAQDGLGNKYGSLSAYQRGLVIAQKHLPPEAPSRVSIGSKVQRIRSASNVHSYKASLSTSMHSQFSNSIAPSPRRSMNRRPPPQKPGDRYYSAEKLTTLHQKLTSGSNVPFVSTDQYFNKTIRKQMNVEQDVPHLRPLSA